MLDVGLNRTRINRVLQVICSGDPKWQVNIEPTIIKDTMAEVSISFDVLEDRETAHSHRPRPFGLQHFGDDRAEGTTAFCRRGQIRYSMGGRPEVASQADSLARCHKLE